MGTVYAAGKVMVEGVGEGGGDGVCLCLHGQKIEECNVVC